MLKHRVDALREIIEASKRDDLRDLLLEMLSEAERALADLETSPSRREGLL